MTTLHARIQLDLLRRFPLLVPTSDNFSTYEGFLKVNDKLFRVSMAVPNYPSSKDLTLKGDWELTELLREHLSALSSLWNEDCVTINTFLEKLHERLVSCLDNGEFTRLSLEGGAVPFQEQINNLHCFSSILSELRELGTDHIEALSSDFGNLSLKSCNINGDFIHLNFKLPSNYNQENPQKNSFEIVDTDLPDAVIKLLQKETTITKAFKNFCEQVEILSHVWNALAELDEHCWVIDPTHPRKADMYRRIFVSPPSVMAQLSWDPTNPNQPPDIKFQGADADIDALRCVYEEHLEDWEPNSSILENLCSVLQLTCLPRAPPPAPSDVSQTVQTGECHICFSVELEGKLPEESCGNVKCLYMYHTACLYEWLEGTGGRQVHGHMSGPCPNCDMVIKCPCPYSSVQ